MWFFSWVQMQKPYLIARRKNKCVGKQWCNSSFYSLCLQLDKWLNRQGLNQSGVNSPARVEQEKREKKQNMPSQDNDRLSSSSYIFYCSSWASMMGSARCQLPSSCEGRHALQSAKSERNINTCFKCWKGGRKG